MSSSLSLDLKVHDTTTSLIIGYTTNRNHSLHLTITPTRSVCTRRLDVVNSKNININIIKLCWRLGTSTQKR